MTTSVGGSIFALAASSIYHSTDNGQTWKLVESDPRKYHPASSAYLYITSSQQILAGKEGSLFLKTDENIIFRSLDNGSTWSSLQSVMGHASVQSMALNPNGDLFALTDSVHLYRSSDLGDSWKQLSLNVPYTRILLFAVGSNNKIAVETDSSYYLSTDSGVNWTALNGADGGTIVFSPNGTIFSVKVTTFGRIFLAGSALVLRSTDNGNTWELSYTYSTVGYYFSFLLNDFGINPNGDAFFTTTDGLYRSIDDGISWSQILWNDQYPNDNETALCFDSYKNLLIGTKYCGLLRLASGDTAFTVMDRTFTPSNVNGIVVNGAGTIFAATDSGVYQTFRNSQEWKRIFSTRDQGTFSILLSSTGILFTETGFSSPVDGPALYRSTDNGVHWQSLGDHGSVVGMGPNGMLFGGYRYGGPTMYRSNDNGDHWTQLSGTDTMGDYVSPDCFAFNLQGHIFAGTYFMNGGGVWRSMDSGTGWTMAGRGLPVSRQNDNVQAFGAVNILGINSNGIIFAATDSGLYRSKDNGESWSRIDESLPMSLLYYYSTGPGTLITKYGLPRVSAIVVNSLDHVYIGYDRGVFYSTDAGDTWNPFNTDETLNIFLKSLAFDGQGYLYGAGSDGTIYRSSSPTTSVPYSLNDVPRTWSLGQNYPNPFNPTTAIPFSIQAQSFVTLEVFDLLGRKVAVIVSEELPAGSYTRRWNGGNDASGIYFYRLQSGTFSETKKLLLLR